MSSLTVIDLFGHCVHSGHFLDLHVFHKGFARARGDRGWFHIRADGTPVYAARFAEIEPFYNGQSSARTLADDYVMLNESGAIVHGICKGTVPSAPDSQCEIQKRGATFLKKKSKSVKTMTWS